MPTVIIGGHELPAAVGRDDCYLAAILKELVAQREQVAALEWGVRAVVRLLAGEREAVEAAQEANEIAAWSGHAGHREPETPKAPAKTTKRQKPKG